MTSRPPRSTKLALLALTVIAVILGGSISAYYLQQTSRDAALLSEIASLQQEIAQENATLSTMSQQVSFLSQEVMSLQQEVLLLESLAAPSVLQLVATINTTVIRSSQSVGVQAFVNNTSDLNFTATLDYVKYSNIRGWSQYSVGPCGSILPLDMALFRGRYDGSNITLAGNPLQTVPFEATSCPNMPYPSYVVFLPQSDETLVNGGLGEPWEIDTALSATSCMLISTSTTCGPDVGISGYYTGWAVSVNNVSNTFHSFEPGSYTVAVGDFWGHSQYLYFEVI